MLPSHVEYYKAGNISEAIELFTKQKKEKKLPVYFAGGTEVLTLSRLNMDPPDVIIDIKGVKESFVLQKTQESLTLGAALPLTYLEEYHPFPLLTEICRGIADRTARNKITLGGNICGKIFYREAVLPFLLADSQLVIAGDKGIEKIPIHSIFNKELLLEEGQFLVQIQTESDFLVLPFTSKKIRQQWDTGYPLITGAAVKKDGEIRMAFSGVCPFPFRSHEMEKQFNQSSLSLEERVKQAVEQVPSPILNDIEGSKEYRLFVLKNLLMDFLVTLEGE